MGGRVWWKVLGWSLWLLLLAAWTAALLSTRAPKVNQAVVPTEWQVWTAKGLHLSAYGFFAFSCCWLAVTGRTRWAVWAGLVVHGILTEGGQTFVQDRYGSALDVGLDATGVALGALAGVALQRWWRPRPPGEQEPRAPAAGARHNQAVPPRARADTMRRDEIREGPP